MPGDWLSPGRLFAFLAVFTRVSTALMLLPLPGIRTPLSTVKIALALGITLILAPAWPSNLALSGTASGAILLFAGEASIGLLLGLVASVAVESLVLSAQVLSLQAGYSYASTIDPSSEADSGLLPVFAQLAGGVFFLSAGLDRQVILALSRSLEAWPPGADWLRPSLGNGVLALGTILLEHGMRLAVPVVALLLLTDLTLAMLARINAQLPLLNSSFSVKMLAALFLLAWLLPGWPAALKGTADACWRALALPAAGRVGG